MGSLNLSPQERRLVAGVGLVVFVFLNVWLVWPHFGDWRRIVDDREKAERTLARYQKEVNLLPKYQVKQNELESMGSRVLASQQDLNLAVVINEQASKHNLQVNSRSDVPAGGTQTNQFFDEKAMRIEFSAKTDSLVNFLESLTSNNSLIRVRDLSIQLEQPPHKLRGYIILVASYQKNPPAAAPAVTNVATAARGVITPAAAKTTSALAPGKATSTVTTTNKAILTNKTTSTLPPPPRTPATNVALPTRRIPSSVKQ